MTGLRAEASSDLGSASSMRSAPASRDGLVALCDKDAEKLATVGRMFPAARQYARADDLIDDPAVQVISIATATGHRTTRSW